MSKFCVVILVATQTAFGAVVHVPVERAVRPAPEIQKRAGVDVSIFNVAVNYVMNLDIGAQGSETQYVLIVDSGSSNTWIGNSKKYVPTSTSSDTGLSISIAYGSGNMTGEEYIDRLSLGSNLTVQQQSIGVANQSNLGSSDDGIIGIGPMNLTVGALSQKDQAVPRVQDNLYQDGAIDMNLVGISFAPTATMNDSNGEITFGGVDDTKFDGTTLNLFSEGAYNKILSLTRAVVDSTVGLPKVTAQQYQALESMYFQIGRSTYELIPDAIRWPKAFDIAIGAAPNDVYLAIGSTGLADGTDIDTYLGMLFHERYYIALDSGAQQIGIAQTVNTLATFN